MLHQYFSGNDKDHDKKLFIYLFTFWLLLQNQVPTNLQTAL